MTQTMSQVSRLRLLVEGTWVQRRQECKMWEHLFIFLLPTTYIYPGFLCYFCWQGQRKTLAISELRQPSVTPESEHVMLEWTEQSASSGMHFNHRAIPRMLQTNIIYKTLSMIFPFYYHLPPSLWLAINAITGTTSKYPHLFATPVNQINYYSLGSYPPTAERRTRPRRLLIIACWIVVHKLRIACICLHSWSAYRLYALSGLKISPPKSTSRFRTSEFEV